MVHFEDFTIEKKNSIYHFYSFLLQTKEFVI